MRLLLDNNLSPRLVEVLVKEGWDVVHVGSRGLRAASDPPATDQVRVAADLVGVVGATTVTSLGMLDTGRPVSTTNASP